MSVNGVVKKSVVLIHGRFDAKFFDALKKRKVKNIFVLEGRPDFKTSKKAVKQLLKRKMRPTIISDNMAGFLFFKNYVKEIWVSYLTDDIDGFLCEVGSTILAVLGKRHNIPVHAVQANGELQLLGHSKDICSFNGVKVAAKGTKAYVPLVDWVNRKYISKVH